MSAVTSAWGAHSKTGRPKVHSVMKAWQGTGSKGSDKPSSIGLVVAGDDPDLAALLEADLGGAGNVAGGVEGDGDAGDVAGLTVGDRFQLYAGAEAIADDGAAVSVAR